MTTTQKSKSPSVTKADVNELSSLLSGQGWMTAKDLAFHANERFLRAVANASEGQIIGGQRGYRLTSEATFEERQHAVNWLRHQAAEMTKRALQIETVSGLNQQFS